MFQPTKEEKGILEVTICDLQTRKEAALATA